MEVYLVCETVDLGYHAVSGYLDIEKAIAECARLNEEYRTDYISSLTKGCSYTYEDAVAYANNFRNYYEVDSVEVVE